MDQIGVSYRTLLASSQEDALALEALEEALSGELPKDYVVRVTGLKLEAALKRLDLRMGSFQPMPLSMPLTQSLTKSLTAQGNKESLNDQEYCVAPVLCADTTVALGRDILGKPSSPEHAHEMLTRLSGRTHQVFTAVALSWGAHTPPPNHPHLSALSISTVEFAALSRAQIKAYVDTGEPMGKAGAYGVQGRAAGFIKNIEGSYSGIMGLPLFECAQLLRQLGIFSI